MKRKLIVSIIVVAIMLVAGIWSASQPPNLYKGNISFQSEQDYSKFKQELIDSGATWRTGNMEVLSSAPPIIVHFYIQVPDGHQFNYGSPDGSTAGDALGALLVGGALLLAILWAFV